MFDYLETVLAQNIVFYFQDRTNGREELVCAREEGLLVIKKL